MALLTGEFLSGGFVRDADDRLVVVVDAAGGASATGTAGYPAGAVPITAASGNQANANAVATLAAASGKFTYITGFTLAAAGSTAALVVNATVAGVVTGTMTYTFTFPVGVAVPATPLVVTFSSPIPSSAVNTAIVVTLPAGGAGNTNASAVATGFQL